MSFLHTSVGRVWRLFFAAILFTGASIAGAHAQFDDPPLLATLQLQSGTGPVGFAPVTLDPVFDSNTFEYNVSIPFEHDEIQVVSATVVPDDFGLHGFEVGEIPPLIAGQTTSFIITAVDNLLPPYFQTTEYTINVTRGASNNVAVLSNLIVNETALAPSFGQLTFEYTGSVPNGTTSLTIIPTAQAATSTITVNGTPASSGSPFNPIDLAEGSNEIIILVMDQGGMGENVTKAYVVDITRLPPSVDSDDDEMDDEFEIANGLTVGINDAMLDLDGDGLSNLGEYAFGSDPNDASDHNDPVVTRNVNGFLVITFNRAIEPDDGSYQVEVSSNLTSWSSTEVAEEGESTPTVQVWRDTSGGASAAPPVRFIRVMFSSSL